MPHDDHQGWRAVLRRKRVAPLPAGARARLAEPADEDALARLAHRDESRPPRGLVLVAEAGPELLAAVSLDDGHAVADPQRPTGELLLLLLDHARRVRRTLRGRQDEVVRVWPRALGPEPGLPPG